MVVSVRSFIEPVLIREEMADMARAICIFCAYRISNRVHRTSIKPAKAREQTYSTVGDINYSVELDNG